MDARPPSRRRHSEDVPTAKRLQASFECFFSTVFQPEVA
uniref:Uncharacterized protein n=1 Tax=Caenorhabditis japonica TaxID=281687 RepID=A0A8R1EWF4_CAEJA